MLSLIITAPCTDYKLAWTRRMHVVYNNLVWITGVEWHEAEAIVSAISHWISPHCINMLPVAEVWPRPIKRCLAIGTDSRQVLEAHVMALPAPSQHLQATVHA